MPTPPRDASDEPINTPRALSVRPAQPRDAERVTEIYNDAIVHTTASFWTVPRPRDEMLDQIKSSTARTPTVVAAFADAHADRAAGDIAGVAWSKPWNPREGYATTVESSVYVAAEARGQGVGRALLRDLCARVHDSGATDVIAGIALPNDASVRLHESIGFRHVGTFDRIGTKFGQRLSVGYWQLKLA
jgi:L-amino acid N-acyltransferase YncA